MDGLTLNMSRLGNKVTGVAVEYATGRCVITVMTTAINAAAWNKARWVRVIAVAVIVPLVACALTIISAMQGDTDLPPYDPPNTVDRVCWAGRAVLIWPAALAVKLGVPADVHPVLIWSLFWSSGLFWAALFELILIAKNARRS